MISSQPLIFAVLSVINPNAVKLSLNRMLSTLGMNCDALSVVGSSQLAAGENITVKMNAGRLY
jgi:hypothetical protein